jgi:hypothetical protein
MELKTLATRNACTCAEDRAETKRFKLARDLCGVQKKIGRKLTTTDVRVASDEWERISLPFLDWNGDDHFAMLATIQPPKSVHAAISPFPLSDKR